jgi:galactokinase
MASTAPSLPTGAAAPRRFRAPGRVNLIGEHTDYNDGFVLPAALDRTTTVTMTPRADRTVTVTTALGGKAFAFDLDDPAPQPQRDWSDYVRGVAVVLEAAGHRLAGADLAIVSDVPLGAGLSSSAALEVSTAAALLGRAGIALPLPEVAKLCQRAENSFVGMNCGIMDQFISCVGIAGHAVMIDCRSLAYEALPVAADARIVICNSMVHHELAAAGQYNLRRAECERGVQLLRPLLASTHGEIAALRDVTLADLEAHKAALPELTYRRCRHVVSENARVLAAAAALGAGDMARFGRLMNLSHKSMRDDYEITCTEIDVLAALAQALPGVYGSRMTGGGFGGCTVSLVEAGAVERVAERLADGYRQATGLDPDIFTCVPGGGVAALDD